MKVGLHKKWPCKQAVKVGVTASELLKTRMGVYEVALMGFFCQSKYESCTNRQVPTASRVCYTKQLLKMKLVSEKSESIVIR